MPYKVKLIIFFVLLLLLFSSFCRSQQFSDPLKPQKFSEKNYGIALGLGGNFQTNQLFSEKCNCYFEDGRGLSFTTKAFYEYKITKLFWIGLNINYNLKNFSSTFRNWENIMLFSEKLNHYEQVNIEMKHNADISLSYLGISPYATLNFFELLYLNTGFNIQYNIYSNIFHQKEILTQSVTLTTGERLKPRFEDTKSQITTIEDQSISDIRKLNFSLNFEVGLNIRLSNLYSLRLSLEYVPMLMPVTNNSNNKYYVNSFNFLISLLLKSKQNTAQ